MAAYITVLIPFLSIFLFQVSQPSSHKCLAFGPSLGKTRTGAATQKEDKFLYTDWGALAFEMGHDYLCFVLRLFSTCFRGFPWSG